MSPLAPFVPLGGVNSVDPALNMRLAVIRWKFGEPKDGLFPVLLRIASGKVTLYHPTGIKIRPGDWNERTQRVRQAHVHAPAFNEIITEVLHGAELLAARNPLLTPEQLRAALGPKGTDLDFYALARARLEKFGPAMNYNTRTQRLWLLDYFERRRPGLKVDDFTPALLEDLQLSMQGLSKNTIATRLFRLRTMWLRVCRDQGLALASPWKDVRIGTTATKVRGHLPDDVERVRLVELSGTLALHRDAYVLAYYLAGMRPGDLCRFSDTDIQGTAVHYKMHKSDKVLRWPIHPYAQEIIERYKGRGAMWGDKRLVLPLLRPEDLASDDTILARINNLNSHTRRSLHGVARLCGLPPFTWYWARHSSSTKAILSGVGNRALQDMLGHSNSKQTDDYAKRLVGELSDEAYRKMYG